MMAYKEVVGKWKVQTSSGVQTTSTMTCTELPELVDKSMAESALKTYKPIVDGTLTAGLYKNVEELEVD